MQPCIWGAVTNRRGTERIAITTSLDEREERNLVATAAEGAKDKGAALSQHQIDAAIQKFPELNFSTGHGSAQRRVMEALGTGGRIGLAIGVAGSGKSPF